MLLGGDVLPNHDIWLVVQGCFQFSYNVWLLSVTKVSIPKCSLYAMFANIYPKNRPALWVNILAPRVVLFPRFGTNHWKT